MPFAQISLNKGTPLSYRETLMEQVYLSMRETVNIPENDRFATIVELEPGNLNNSGNYAGIDRSENVVFIQITLNSGRSTDQKKALYAEIARRLADDPGIRPEDIIVSLIEVAAEDWSLGNGVAQYA